MNSRRSAASDYFNSLPIEQRKLLAPLLEEYRRMGLDEALRALDTVRRQLAGRAHTITALADDRDLFDSDEDLRAFLEATGNPQEDGR